MAKTLEGLTRREAVKGAASLAVALVAGGCATFSDRPVTNSDFSRDGIAGILFDYPQHGYHITKNPKGIDLTTGFGTLMAAPTIGDVWDSDTIPAGTLIKIETPFGHIIELACGSAVYVKINDKVTPFTIIGREGMDCGKGEIGGIERADKPHVHMGIFDPPFAPKYKQGHLPFIRQNGITHHLVDPNTYRAHSNHISNSNFTGDVSQVENLVAEAKKRFYGIAERHPESLFALFVRESNKDPKIRFSPKVMVAYNMLENGLLEKPQLREEVRDYLRWHSNLTGFLFAPYANPQLIVQYRQQQPLVFEGKAKVDYKGAKKKVEKAWAEVDSMFKDVRYKQRDKIFLAEMLSSMENFRDLTPIYGQAANERGYGVVQGNMRNWNKALVHLLLSEALLGYKYEPTEPIKVSWSRYWTYRSLAWVLEKSDEKSVTWKATLVYQRKYMEPALKAMENLRF